MMVFNKDKVDRIYKGIKAYSVKSQDNRIDVYAACSSFYIFMSFIPFLIIIISVIPFLPFSKNDFENSLMSLTPSHYEELVRYVIDELYMNGKTALSVSIIVTIWSAARGLIGITKGLNQIYGIQENRSFIYMRIRSAFYTLFLIVSIILMLIIPLFGNFILGIIRKYISIPDFYIGLFHYKNIFMFCVLLLFFTFMFVKLPAKKLTYKSQFPGALFATVIWWTFTRLFSLYLSTFDSYSVYGSFAVIIIIGVWLYTGMLIMFNGAQLNEYLAHRKGNKNERSN